MTNSHAYLLVLEIEPISSVATYTTIPLHCTVVPWFRVAADEAALIASLKPLFDATQPVLLVAGQQDQSSPLNGRHRIAVNHIQKTAQLVQLHDALCERLLAAGSVFDEPARIGAGFAPHVIECMGLQLAEGSRHRAVRAHLFVADAATGLAQAPKRVVATFPLAA